MFQMALWDEDVAADFDPSCWHSGWSEPMPCDESDLVWDESNKEDE